MQKELLYRPRIDRAMHKHKDYPVLFVIAPMGCGKSTAVKHYLEKSNLENVFISTLYNNDFQVWHNICEAIYAKRENVGRLLRSIGFPVVRYLIPQIIEAFKQTADDPLTIVIDDYHLIAEDSAIHHTLFALAMEHIPGLQVICVARAVPTWLVAEMRTKELCEAISADILAFDSSEVLSYLNMRVVLPSAAYTVSQAEKIWVASEGWIAIVVLLVEGLRQGRQVAPFESTHDLFEYTFFQQLKKSEQKFIIKLATLEDFTLEQAEFILKKSKSALLIKRLWTNNVFISYDVNSKTYKMHSLLREFLAHKATIYNINTKEVLLNFARWEYAKGQYASALNYYYRSGNGIEFFERLTIEERVYIPFEYREIFYDIFKDLPLETALRLPLIYTYISLHFIASGVLELERFALKCINYLKRHFVGGDVPHPHRERIICELQIAIYASRNNDPYACIDLRKCNKSNTLRSIVAPFACTTSLSAGLPSYLYCLYRKPGELDRLIAFAEEHFDCECLAGLWYGFDKLLHAEKHLERGELDKAKQFSAQAIQKGWLREQIYIVACAHTVLLRIALFEGDRNEAEKHINIIKFEILSKVSFKPFPDAVKIYAKMGELVEIIAYSMMRNPERLKACIPKLQDFGKEHLYRGLGMPDLIKIKYKILCGEFSEAEVFCDYYITHSPRPQPQLGFFRYMIFRAIVNEHLYGVETAIPVLQTALEAAAIDNIIAPFAENAEFILKLLELMQPTKRLPSSFLNSVRSLAVQFQNNLKPTRSCSKKGILTVRESEVFNLLSTGLSQKSIAATLNISSGTVKRHLENIYLKLGVNSRVSALNKGLMLGLWS